MAAGRAREAWNHTAELLAMMVNTVPLRPPNARLAQARDFHPDHRAAAAEADEPLKVPLAMLFPLFGQRA